MPAATLHQLRHSFATLLLAEGVPLATISAVLGHSGLQVTLDHYAAITPEVLRPTADAIDRAMRGSAS
jgi:site-specific recombinase XerD